MAVVAHAKYQHVDAGQLGQGLIGFQGSSFKAGRCAVEAKKPCLGRFASQQMALEQASIAVGMLDRHPALIGQGHQDLRPVQRLLDQCLEKRHRATPTRHHQGSLAVCRDRGIQAPGDILGQTFGQLRGSVEIMGRHVSRQLQFRYRHTKTSHHG
ncbi:hypothetical protein D3C72_1649560 [compost metagenome]